MNWKEKIKLGLWGAVGGAIVLLIIGFGFGGWVKGSTAQRMAEEMAQDAVLDRLVPICVVKFNQDPNKEARLKELKAKSYYQRSDYVKESGWATMPGEKEADSKVANECARRLVDLEK